MENNFAHETIVQRLTAEFGPSVLSFEEPYGLLTITVNPVAVHAIVAWLKNDATLQVSFLTNLGAVHYPDRKGEELALVYHLHSLVNNLRVRLKAYVPIDRPEIETITDMYAGANWMERETYDFFGVIFKGHPNLVRILNEDTMNYFPMRKEYHLEDATREDKDDRFFGR